VQIPEFLLTAPLNLVGAYLAGVFDGDGCYTCVNNKKFKTTKNHRVLFVSGSEKFIKGIQTLLFEIHLLE